MPYPGRVCIAFYATVLGGYYGLQATHSGKAASLSRAWAVECEYIYGARARSCADGLCPVISGISLLRSHFVFRREVGGLGYGKASDAGLSELHRQHFHKCLPQRIKRCA